MTRDLVHGEYPDSQSESLNSDEMRKWAEEHEMFCRYPEPNELLIDIDDQASYLRFHRTLDVLGGQMERPFDILSWREYPSKTGDTEHKHIVVTLSNPVTPADRILLQACFGSDLTRELLSYLRLLQNDPHPTMLARPKEVVNA